MRHLLAKARDSGRLYTASQRVMVDLALEVCQAAIRHEVEDEDAAEIYEAYLKGKNGVSHHDLRSLTTQVQISKLRQIIKLGNEDKNAKALLERVIKVYTKKMETPPSDAAYYLSLYSVMIAAARFRLVRGRDPNDLQILKMMNVPKIKPKK